MSRIIISGLLLFTLGTAQAHLQPLNETEMSAAHGAGIAVALDQFRYAMAPTSYFEQTGITPAGACTAAGNSSGNVGCWRRGDLRWYGVNISGTGAGGSHWNESSCDASTAACPRGGQIAWFSPFDNPYVMRSWSPQGMAWDGSLINQDASNPDKTIYEFLAPTRQPDYTFSFWGEIEAGATRDTATQALQMGQGANNPSGGGLLKSQTLIRGNAAGSIFRLFQHTEPGNETFGMFYHSYLQGDFRFSVAQAADNATDQIGEAPTFDPDEGLFFRNVDAFLPFGQVYYQALVLGPVGNNGDFYLELTPVPDNPAVYNRFYGLDSGDVRGFETARTATRDWQQACGESDSACQNYRLSHGYVRYGDWYPAMAGWNALGTRETVNASDDGIVFQARNGSTFNAFAKRPVRIDKRGENSSMQRTQNYRCDPNSPGACFTPTEGPVSSGPGNNNLYYTTDRVSLGSARIEGLLINQFYMESCRPGVC